ERREASHPHRPWGRLRVEGRMTFSVRVALMTAIAVAIAAISASVLMYFVLQTQLLSQFDNTLVEAASGVREQSTGSRGGPGRFPGGPTGGLSGRSDVAAQLIHSTTRRVGRSGATHVGEPRE